MSFSQARIAGENLFLEIVVNGCYDCPMKYGVSETCFLIGSCGLNRNRTCVEHNCPAPVLIGENVGIILHVYTEKKIAPQNTIETGDTAHNSGFGRLQKRKAAQENT